MMRKVFFILLISFVVKIHAQTWQVKNSGVNVTLQDICFVDTLHGWAVGDNATILLTNNGGENWIKLLSPLEFIALKKVQFVSETVGFIISTGGSFLSTTDGGINWNISSILADSTGFSYSDFCFVNENEGWVTGRKEGKNYGIGVIMHTNNGGKTWEKQLELLSYIQTDAKFFSSIKFANSKVGWALASDYFDNFSTTYVYKTDSGGLKWQNISTLSNVPNYTLKIVGNDTLWCGGTVLFISNNGGVTWGDNQHYGPGLLSVISPENGLKGWVFYWNIFSGQKQILRTTDGGKTWIDEINLTEVISGMTNISGYLWIVGTNGLIMRRVPTTTSVSDNVNSITSEYYLFQNYPNPFNPITTISFTLPHNEFVNLKIMDVLGRDIKTIFSGFRSAGTYNLKFDASNFGSGTYFYQLQAGTFVKTKKLILMK